MPITINSGQSTTISVKIPNLQPDFFHAVVEIVYNGSEGGSSHLVKFDVNQM
jgi:hypothetical protein